MLPFLWATWSSQNNHKDLPKVAQVAKSGPIWSPCHCVCARWRFLQPARYTLEGWVEEMRRERFGGEREERETNPAPKRAVSAGQPRPCMAHWTSCCGCTQTLFNLSLTLLLSFSYTFSLSLPLSLYLILSLSPFLSLTLSLSLSFSLFFFHIDNTLFKISLIRLP